MRDQTVVARESLQPLQEPRRHHGRPVALLRPGDDHVVGPESLHEIVRRLADAALGRRKADAGAHGPVEKRVGDRARRPCALVEPAQHDPIHRQEPRFEQAEDLDAAMRRAGRRTESLLLGEGGEEGRIIDEPPLQRLIFLRADLRHVRDRRTAPSALLPRGRAHRRHRPAAAPRALRRSRRWCSVSAMRSSVPSPWKAGEKVAKADFQPPQQVVGQIPIRLGQPLSRARCPAALVAAVSGQRRAHAGEALAGRGAAQDADFENGRGTRHRLARPTETDQRMGEKRQDRQRPEVLGGGLRRKPRQTPRRRIRRARSRPNPRPRYPSGRVQPRPAPQAPDRASRAPRSGADR